MSETEPSETKTSKNRSIWIATLVIGLVIGLALGIFVSVLFNLPSLFHTGVGVNTLVQVSGTVQFMKSGTLYFQNANQTIQTTATVTSGQYSVLLIGGQPYNVYVNNPTIFEEEYGYAPLRDYNSFYAPLGVTTFTENLTVVKS
jgi:hypothetical protein